MSWASHNPELYDEIITGALPEPWKSRVENDEIELTDVPQEIFYKAEQSGTADYWGGLIDEAKERRKLGE
jgi:hypothetical protein